MLGSSVIDDMFRVLSFFLSRSSSGTRYSLRLASYRTGRFRALRPFQSWYCRSFQDGARFRQLADNMRHGQKNELRCCFANLCRQEVPCSVPCTCQYAHAPAHHTHRRNTMHGCKHRRADEGRNDNACTHSFARACAHTQTQQYADARAH